jgi:phosphoribosylglycinamide formyltransferase-1
MKKRVAIFVSGSGTNMENIAKKVQSGELDCEIVTIVCDHPEAKAIERANRLGLSVFLIERKNFKTKAEFESQISEHLRKNRIDLILLAGFMRILGPEFVRVWKGKILNIHPSLLPKYPGAHAIRDAFEAKEKETGVTIHFVTEEVDAGPIILQGKVPVKADDTIETLEARVHALEYELYPEAVRLFLDGKLSIEKSKVKIDFQKGDR